MVFKSRPIVGRLHIKYNSNRLVSYVRPLRCDRNCDRWPHRSVSNMAMLGKCLRNSQDKSKDVKCLTSNMVYVHLRTQRGSKQKSEITDWFTDRRESPLIVYWLCTGAVDRENVKLWHLIRFKINPKVSPHSTNPFRSSCKSKLS